MSWGKALNPNNVSVCQSLNIGTQSVQELFFCDRSIRRTVYSNDLLSFLVAMYSKKGNWEFMMYI